MKIAILGASGFVGSRAVEYWTLTQQAEVRCVVRTFSGLARSSRFDAEWRLASLSDERQLATAFEGCDVLLHTVAGDHAAIARQTSTIYRAAASARVQRLVYISSAAVYGDLRQPQIDESTTLPRQNRSVYAAAKLSAENQLLKLAQGGSVGITILRPSIITGPRSMWIAEPARQLLGGGLNLVEGGPGVCNTIYVDNLLDAVLLAAQRPEAVGQVFLTADADCISWGEFYRGLARELALSPECIGSIPRSNAAAPTRGAAWLQRARFSAPYQIAGLLMPKSFKQSLKWRLQRGIDRWPTVHEDSPAGASYDQNVLHLTSWRITNEKARRLLGYQPAVTVAEGLRRSAAWLKFAGWL